MRLQVILIQMFIAVISEGFAVAEEEKHKQQLDQFVKRSHPPVSSQAWIDRINPYLYVGSKQKKSQSKSLTARVVLPLRQITLKDLILNESSSDKNIQRPAPALDAQSISPKRFLRKRADSSSSHSLMDKQTINGDNQSDEEEDLDKHLCAMILPLRTSLNNVLVGS